MPRTTKTAKKAVKRAVKAPTKTATKTTKKAVKKVAPKEKKPSFQKAIIAVLRTKKLTHEDILKDKELKKNYGSMQGFNVRGIEFARWRHNSNNPEDQVPRMVKVDAPRCKAGWKLVEQEDKYPGDEKPKGVREPKEETEAPKRGRKKVTEEPKTKRAKRTKKVEPESAPKKRTRRRSK